MKMAGLEGLPILGDFLCREMFGRDLKLREDRFSEGLV
jgi:hypothetical protein